MSAHVEYKVVCFSFWFGLIIMIILLKKISEYFILAENESISKCSVLLHNLMKIMQNLTNVFTDSEIFILKL